MNRLKKILPAVGLALLIAFGTLAAGMAQEPPLSGPRNFLELRGGVKNGPAQMDRYTLSVGMDSETGGLSNSLNPESEVYQVISFHDIQTLRLSISNRPQAAKVPLQLLDLVLII